MPALTTAGHFRIQPFPKRRRLVTDIGWLSRARHSMRALIEVDVTNARARIRKVRRRTGKPLSFTTFLVATVAQAVHRTGEVNASHASAGRIAYFDNVSLLAMVEAKDADGSPIPIGHILPNANLMTVWQIEESIDFFRTHYDASEQTRKLDLLTSVPGPIRRLLFGRMPRNPRFIQSTMGTVVVSAVGLFLPGHAAWALGQGNHTVSIWVGSTIRRTILSDGIPTQRTMACLTVDIDHDIVDGAPAARFVASLVQSIESAEVLKEHEDANAFPTSQSG